MFYGHEERVKSFILENRIQYQTGCYYASLVTCKSRALASLLPSLHPGAVLTDKKVQWTGIFKPDYARGPDLWQANIKAAERAATKVLCKQPCCCKGVKIKSYVVGSWTERAQFPIPEPKSKIVNC